MFNIEKIPDEKTIVRKAELADAPLILSLLARGLAKNLPEEEKNDGLYFEPTQDELEKIINDTGIFICLKDSILKGYFMTMSKELAQANPFMSEFIECADKMTFNDKSLSEYKYAVLAQILIAKEFRKSGRTFIRLHDRTQSALAEAGYELLIGEIADQNKKSLDVHSKFFEDIGTYNANSGITWHVMVAEAEL